MQFVFFFRCCTKAAFVHRFVSQRHSNWGTILCILNSTRYSNSSKILLSQMSLNCASILPRLCFRTVTLSFLFIFELLIIDAIWNIPNTAIEWSFIVSKTVNYIAIEIANDANEQWEKQHNLRTYSGSLIFSGLSVAWWQNYALKKLLFQVNFHQEKYSNSINIIPNNWQKFHFMSKSIIYW